MKPEGHPRNQERRKISVDNTPGLTRGFDDTANFSHPAPPKGTEGHGSNNAEIEIALSRKGDAKSPHLIPVISNHLGGKTPKAMFLNPWTYKARNGQERLDQSRPPVQILPVEPKYPPKISHLGQTRRHRMVCVFRGDVPPKQAMVEKLTRRIDAENCADSQHQFSKLSGPDHICQHGNKNDVKNGGSLEGDGEAQKTN
jgi:hypothetical protein